MSKRTRIGLGVTVLLCPVIIGAVVWGSFHLVTFLSRPKAKLFVGYEAFGPLNVPSPTGRSVVSTVNYLDSAYTVNLIADASAPHKQPLVILEGGREASNPYERTIVVAWNGDHHLTIAWPIGAIAALPTKIGPARVGDIDLTYTVLNMDPSVGQPRKVDTIVLTNVHYEFEDWRPDAGETFCTIRVSGSDGKFFSEVKLDAEGMGGGSPRKPRQLGGGTFHLLFTLTPLPDLRSPPLTPTQAMLADISPPRQPRGATGAPVQDGKSLRYLGFYEQEMVDVFRVFRDGNYKIRFNLAFGEQQLEYIVSDRIPRDIADAYQKCEDSTVIFTRRLSPLLTR